MNPMVVDGQVHGGVAQAVAAALYEEGVYDEEGNLVTQNLTTYLMPSAASLPSFEVARTETPSPTNPLGVKGVGETGAIAAPAVINAVVDALSHLGVTDIPCRPRRSVSGARSRRRSSDPGTVRLQAVAESVEHALELLGQDEAKLLAGGHSLIPAMRISWHAPRGSSTSAGCPSLRTSATGERRSRSRP